MGNRSRMCSSIPLGDSAESRLPISSLRGRSTDTLSLLKDLSAGVTSLDPLSEPG